VGNKKSNMKHLTPYEFADYRREHLKKSILLHMAF
jgi:hypothetical protein